MFVVCQERVDGSIQLHWMKTVALDPKNGGWIQGIRIDGSSLGTPVGQIKAVGMVPQVSDDV